MAVFVSEDQRIEPTDFLLCPSVNIELLDKLVFSAVKAKKLIGKTSVRQGP
jgi:hypothetical protein